ncbi:MAG TPA: hypothetical protein VMU47_11265 [Caldimonas sp.]|nr:hypothetical protein [Caldimonas sp.]
MPLPLAEALAPRVTRLGYLGEWFRCAAHAPEVLLAFQTFTDALKDAVSARVAEAVVLTVATELGNDYERNQHERLSMRTGYGQDWIAEVEARDPDAAVLMSARERAAQRFALAVLRTRGTATHAEFEALLDHFQPDEAIAIAMLVGRYFTHSIGVHALRLAPPVPSIFEDRFDPLEAR